MKSKSELKLKKQNNDNQIFKVGDSVQWTWMGKKILGQVVEVYSEPIVKVIKNKKIKRNGSPDNPAYYVKSEAGNFALKLLTEVESIKIEKTNRNRPTMFG